MLLKTISIISFLFSFTIVLFAKSQILVNQSWDHITGIPVDSFELNLSTFDPFDNLIVVANTYTSGENANILISKYNKLGQLLWQKEFNSISNGIDFGTGVSTNSSGDIFLIGGTFDQANGNIDYITLKLDQNNGGTIWQAQYNGPGNGEDLPTGIIVDDNGVYVTGRSWGNGTDFDYATVKYDLMGNQSWDSRYNHSNGIDIPAGIEKKTNGDIVVTGGSDNSINGRDFASVRYNNNGAQVGVQRGNPNNLGLDQPAAITKDNSGNIFITGRATTNGINFDIKTVKINTSFSIEWERVYDGSGLEDAGTDVEIDNQGNVYVCGFTENILGGRNFITIKYNNAGDLLWTRTRGTENLMGEAEATNMLVEDEGVCYVTGNVFNGNDRDILTIRYNSNGETQWEKQFDGIDQGEDQASIIKQDSEGSVYVSGTTENGGDNQNITIKYEQFDRSIEPELDVQGNPSHIQNEVLIRFDGSVVDSTIVNNTGIQFGIVKQFIDPSVITLMDEFLNAEGQLENWKMSKVYKQITTDQKYSINRIRDTIHMPDFWANLILYTPKEIEYFEDEISISKLLDVEDLKPFIWHAEPNYIGKWLSVPNDSLYLNKQHSLHPTNTYPHGHINVEGAWDIDIGSDLTTVAFYDSGINYTHEDLIDPNGKSRVIRAYDWLNNVPINTNDLNPSFKPDSNTIGHGTAVSGIVGALRNNATGIAGIAGGDVDSLSNFGVNLVSAKIGNDAPASIDIIVQAIQKGAESSSQIDIMNHSWVITTQSYTLREVIHHAARMLITNVCGIGNDGVDDPYYPASYNDDWVTNVGASGIDGNFKDAGNGQPQKPKDEFVSNYGGNIDLIAPGSSALVKSLGAHELKYGNYRGTSISAPHVTGVSALLRNHGEKNGLILTPEDIEHLLELGATDKGSLGYDDSTGWGLLNATASIQLIESPQYNIQQEKTNSAGTNPAVFATNIPILLAEPYEGLSSGLYYADVYKISLTSSHSLQPDNVIVNAWVRNNSSDPWGFSNPLYPEENISLDSYTNTQATLSGYIYYFKYKSVGLLLKQINVWQPYSLNHSYKFAYSLHVYDSTATTTSRITEEANILSANLYPNPSDNNVMLSYYLPQHTTTSVTIFDIEGRMLKEFQNGFQNKGNHDLIMDMAMWPAGIYFCRIKTIEASIRKKIIIF